MTSLSHEKLEINPYNATMTGKNDMGQESKNSPTTPGYNEVKDYFLIGNLYSAALVSNKASIDWLCLPHFDSPSVFAKLLDTENGGSFSLCDPSTYKIASEYIKDTAVVSHTIESSGGKAVLNDFMLPQPKVGVKNHFLVRELRGVEGDLVLTFSFTPKPDYASKKPDLGISKKYISLPCHDGTLLLHFPSDSKIESFENGVSIIVPVSEGSVQKLLLEFLSGDKLAQEDSMHPDMLEETKGFWKEWVREHKYVDFCRDQMARSAITLKLMQFYPTGAIIASPTTSLPEDVGGIRNWDYRYVWLRDATFTLYSLSILGCTEEAIKFFEFLEQSVRWEENAKLELMYTVHGQRVPDEYELPHLSGYLDSQPVRVGNDAVNQFQLDLYGTMIDFIYFSTIHGIEMTDGMRRLTLRLIILIEENWHKKDQGIWEMRTEPQHFTHSKVASWVGIDRAIRMSEELGISSEEFKKLEDLRSEIYDWIYENTYDAQHQTFLQHPETDATDSTNFLFVMLQFLDKESPETKAIIKETAKELRYNDTSVLRYKNRDGLPGNEGAFVLSTFWLISALAMTGEPDEAMALFKKFEDLMPSNGLIAEEIDPRTHDYLGNFPQGFSHMGYIMSAYYINRYMRGEDVREDLPPL